MDHDLGVRQGEAVALGSAGQQDGAAAGGHADAVGGHRAFQELYRVVNGKGGRDRAAGAADIKMDLLGGVLVLQVQQLHDDIHGAHVVDDSRQENDAVFQEQI